MRILDISRRLGPATPAWPGDTPFSLHWTASHGDGAAVSSISFSPHLGTHVDAPLHILPGAGPVDTIPLATCFGPCRVVDLRGPVRSIGPAEISHLTLSNCPRVLLKTGSWPEPGSLPRAFSGLSPAAVDALADAGALLVGIDGPSIDPSSSTDLAAHRRCVALGVLIIEGLDLAGVEPGNYTLVAFPLRLGGVEASPVRAVLLDEEAL